MEPTRKRALFIGIGLLSLLIVFNAVTSYRHTRELQEAANWVGHTHEVLAALQQLISTIKGAEANQRGFLITGDPKYLKPYNDALEGYEKTLARFEALTSDNSYQQERIRRLRELIEGRLETLAQNIAIRKEQGFDAVKEAVASGRGTQAMVNVQALASEIEQHENELLKQRKQDDWETYRSNILSDLIVAMIGLCGLILFAWLLRVHLAAQEESNALIHEQRELLQATLSSIGDAVIATDVDGHVTFLNEVAQALTGWSQDDAIRKPLSDVFHIVNEETRQRVDNPAIRALREDKIVGLANHTVLISKVGMEWPIDDSAAPIRTLDGKLSGAILVFREITERRRHEDELRESLDALREANQHKDELMSELRDADRRKDEFLATLAHELRNPLSPISNALQVWPLVENDPEQLERLRGVMERQVRQIIRLIDDLMDVSRISRGRIQLQKQRVDLRTVISEAIESVQPLIDAENHRVTIALPAQPLFVDGDVARLTQVFGNVLHNAVKYAGRTGVIWIAAERRDGQAAVSIRDNGPGIPKHMLSQIFEM
jgi:PAS domain S-box-containing protein